MISKIILNNFEHTEFNKLHFLVLFLMTELKGDFSKQQRYKGNKINLKCVYDEKFSRV